MEALDLAVGLRPADVVVLTATPYQNTLFRMALPILARHRCHVFLPYAKNRVSRDEKLQVARSLGFTHRSTTHSIDENLWGRVIEEGGLQNPENPIPDDGVFAWTVDPATVTRDSRDMAIAFVDGLPTAIDGTPADLRGLIAHLNAEAGAYGIGRYTGLEETPLGYQNHEVREAPAATVIMAAHADLLRSTVGAMTASAFQDNAALWVELACWGHTETPLFRAVSAFITQLNQGMNGRVTMRLAPGSCFVVARQVPSPRCHHLPLSGAADVIAGLSLPAFMATVAHRV